MFDATGLFDASKLLLLVCTSFICSVKRFSGRCFRSRLDCFSCLCFVYFVYMISWMGWLSSSLNFVIRQALSGLVRATAAHRTDIWGVSLYLSLWLSFCFRTTVRSVGTHFCLFVALVSVVYGFVPTEFRFLAFLLVHCSFYRQWWFFDVRASRLRRAYYTFFVCLVFDWFYRTGRSIRSSWIANPSATFLFLVYILKGSVWPSVTIMVW